MPFQDRTGCPNKITTIREKFGECFEKMGGVEALYEWAKENQKSFYSMYSKMAEKNLKVETHARTHEQFIELMMMKEKKVQLDKGKPAMLIDAPSKEIHANTVVNP